MKKYILGVVAVLFFMMIIGFVVTKQEKVLVESPTPDKIELVDIEHTKFENEYISFVYPVRLTMDKAPTTDGRVYVSAVFGDGKKDIASMTLLFRESTQELNELDDVRMRRGNSYQYSEEVARTDNDRGLLFRTADRKERVAYMISKGRLLVLALTTTGPYNESIEKEFQEILNSVVWK
jgi:hypothetical protein